MTGGGRYSVLTQHQEDMHIERPRIIEFSCCHRNSKCLLAVPLSTIKAIVAAVRLSQHFVSNLSGCQLLLPRWPRTCSAVMLTHFLYNDGYEPLLPRWIEGICSCRSLTPRRADAGNWYYPRLLLFVLYKCIVCIELVGKFSSRLSPNFCMKYYPMRIPSVH